MALQYVEEFVQSELLARKLTYLCCKKLGNLCGSTEAGNSNAIFEEYLACPHHRDVVLGLGAIIQVVLG